MSLSRPLSRGLPFVLWCLLALAAAAGADEDPGPPPLDTPEAIAAHEHALIENPALADAMRKAEQALSFAAACQAAECPKIDCDAAYRLLEDLKALEYVLRAYITYSTLSKDAHMAHWQSLVENSIQTGENLSNAQNALAWQKYLHDLSKSIADVASLLDTFKSFSQKGFGDDWATTLEQLDSLEQRLDTIDGLAGRIGGAQGVEGLGDVYTSPVVGSKGSGLSTPRKGLVDSAKTIRKIKNEMNKLREANPGLRPGDAFGQALKNKWSPQGAGGSFLGQKEGIRKSFYGWIHKGLSAYNETLMAERKARIDALVNDLSAEDKAVGSAYLGYQGALREMELAERTMQQVKAVIAALPGCLAKAECPSASVGFRRPNIPDFHDYESGTLRERWGAALQFLRKLTKEQADLIEIPGLEDDCAEDDTALFLGDDWGPGTDILIGFDSPLWCTYQSGNPTPTGLTPPPTGGDDDDPRDSPPPEDGGGAPPGTTPPPEGGDDPRDTPTRPCDQELEIINRFLEEHGDQLRSDSRDRSLSAEQRARQAQDLDTITKRKKELEKECPPEDGDDGSGDGGDDPRDAGGPPPSSGEARDPCDELRDLRTHATHLGREIRDPGTTAARRAEAQAQLDEVVDRIEKLEKDCPEPDGDDPRDAGTPPPTSETLDVPKVTIYVKAKSSVTGPNQVAQGLPGQQFKIFVPATQVALPGPGVDKPQTDHDEDPIQGVTDANGNLALGVPVALLPPGLGDVPAIPGGPAYAVDIAGVEQSSVNVLMGGASLDAALDALPRPYLPLVSDLQMINGQPFITLTYPQSMDVTVQSTLVYIPGVVLVEINYCRDKQQASPADPLYVGRGAWQQDYDNQWAIKRVGLDDSADSAWKLIDSNAKEVVVAVIDTGLDWNHLDMSWDNIWRNAKEVPDNGIDDDGNGYIDDIIGWDFYGNTNRPWDHDGHGTFVAGVIAATQNNGEGIAGINPNARIMVLKALNNFGHSRASYLARAIVYAADNGARIVNMSVGGKNLSRIEAEAIGYAASKGVLIVVASGNEGVDISNFGPAGEAAVLSVGATGFEDEHQPFSNWGANLDIVAPGLDVLGLRARRTDTMRDIPDVEYVDGANYVGEDRRYYRASGTSFSAPIVAGVASLVLSNKPELSAQEVKRILLQTATDVEVPGVDQLTGHGLVNARAALKADPDFFISGSIDGVAATQKSGRTFVSVAGSVDANKFGKAWLELGAGDNPSEWRKVGQDIRKAVSNGPLTEFDAAELAGSQTWTIRLIVEHSNGERRESRFVLNLG